MYDMEALYGEYARAIYKYLLSIGCDSMTAEDIVQETFCQAIKSIHRYDGSCKISVWLCQIAKHLWYRELTRRNKAPTVELTEEVATDDLSVLDSMIDREERNTLTKIIDSLPLPVRRVVKMRIYSNMSFREIGIIMGKTENWARVTYYRGKKTIVERWRENET